MYCENCHEKNNKSAYFCKKCGKEFREQERKVAREKGFVAFLRKVEKWYNRLTLKVVTSHIAFKIFVLVLLFSIGIHSFYTIGNNLRIEDSPNYEKIYNKELEEYYIFLKEEENIIMEGKVFLDFYIPNQVENLKISYYEENGQEIYSLSVPKQEAIEFVANMDTNKYYIVTAPEMKPLKIYVYYPREEGKNE